MPESISTGRSSRFELLVSLWIYMLAIITCSVCVGMVALLSDQLFSVHFGGRPLPGLFLGFGVWFFVVPVPWILAACWLTFADAVTVSRCLIFSATSTLAIAFLFGTTLIGLILPFMPFLSPISAL